MDIKRTSFVIQTKAVSETDPLSDMTREIKRLLDGFTQIEMLMEQKKRVMHVATIAGVNKYHLPMGAVIGGNDNPLAHIWFAGTVEDGKFIRSKDENGRYVIRGANDSKVRGTPSKRKEELYSMEVHRSGKVTIRDEGGNELPGMINVEEDVALEKLNKHALAVGLKQKPDKFGKAKYNTLREPQAGQHRATYKELKEHGLLTSQLTDIFLWDNPKGKTSMGTAFDRRGGSSPGSLKKDKPGSTVILRSTTAAFKEQAAVVEKMHPKMRVCRAQTVKDAMAGDPRAQVALVMMTTAMRVDDTHNGRSFGASSLQRRHVTIDAEGVKFKFMGKNGLNSYRCDDPQLRALMVKVTRNKTANDPLFPEVGGRSAGKPITAKKVNEEYISPLWEKHGVSGVNNKMLRMYRASDVIRNEEVPAYLNGNGGQITSEEDFLATAEAIRDYIAAEILHDDSKELVWKSYADPYLLKPLLSDKNQGWLTTWANKVATSRVGTTK